jgi:tetratricopeptide (TPR) repeat protein
VHASNLGATSDAAANYRQAAALLDDALRRRPGDADAVRERLVVTVRLASIAAYTGNLRDAVAAMHAAIQQALPFAASGGDDLRAALADAYRQSSEALRNLEDRNASLVDAAESVRLAEAVAAARPNDVEQRASLATAYAALGMSESLMVRIPDALSHHRRGVEEMERVVATDPRNVQWKRDLMMSYAHVADILGNPGLGNLGDRAGALQAFRRAAALAKELYESDRADQRAVADYGIALSRVETVMPDGTPDKTAVQRESLTILAEAAAVDPSNVQMKIYQALVAQHLGDSLVAANDRAGAREAYARSMQVAEPAIPSGQASLLILFLQTAPRLAKLDAASGRRSDALDAGRRALKAGESGATRTRARAYAALGFAYAAVADSAASQPGDREQAVAWLTKSLDAWHAGKAEPGFAAPHQREMDQVSDMLSRLRPLKR